jgi:hypothetical protein
MKSSRGERVKERERERKREKRHLRDGEGE